MHLVVVFQYILIPLEFLNLEMMVMTINFILNKPNISMEMEGQDDLEMFMSLHSSLYVPFGD